MPNDDIAKLIASERLTAAGLALTYYYHHVSGCKNVGCETTIDAMMLEIFEGDTTSVSNCAKFFIDAGKNMALDVLDPGNGN